MYAEHREVNSRNEVMYLIYLKYLLSRSGGAFISEQGDVW